MSPTLLREYIFSSISKFSILFFAILTFFLNVNYASATTLSACGEIAVSGTYTLSGDLGTPGSSCLIITTSGVTIDGSSSYSVLGNISGNRTNYTLNNVVSTGDLSIFYYNNAAADGNWANKANWWLDSAYTLTANRAGVTVPGTQDEVVINGNVSQISTGVASVKSARFINNATWNSGSSITDGLVWTKYDNSAFASTLNSGAGSYTNGRIPLGSGASIGDTVHVYPLVVIKDGATYKMWYQGADASYNRIFYATSANGIAWTKYDNSVQLPTDTVSTNGRIPLGNSGRGDSNGIASAWVIKEGGTFKMWYTGIASDGKYRGYYATSPDGLTWTKYNNETPLASDSVSTDGRIPVGTSGKGDSLYALVKQVLKDGDLYKMWYRGSDGSNTRTFLATSPDGLTWTKYDNSVPAASDIASTNGRIALGTPGKGDDVGAQIPIIYKDGAIYKMLYAGYSSMAGNSYSAYYATSPDGLTWTKYDNASTTSALSDGASSNGKVLRGNSGRADSTGILPLAGIIDGNLFKLWYSGYNGTNWRGLYATAPNSYRALNLSVDSAGAVSFEDNSKFGKGTISTSDSNPVSSVSFSGTSIATEAVIRANTVNINTSTTTAGIFEIANNNAVVNVSNINTSSTLNITGSNSDLNLNGGAYLSTALGNNLDVTLNGTSRVGTFSLTGTSTVRFNTTYYHGSSAPTGGKLVINNGGFDGIIQSGTTFYDSNNNSLTSIEFRGSTQNTSKGLTIPISFYDSSTNTGTINANVIVNSPVTRPIGGTITGSITYVGYNAGFYYNNAANDGSWANSANWWADSNFSTPATTALQYDDVYVSGNVYKAPVDPTDQALSLNGSGYASRANVNVGKAYTLEFWAKTTQSFTYNKPSPAIWYGSTASSFGSFAFALPNWNEGFYFAESSHLSNQTFGYNKAADGRWRHWVMVRDNGCTKLYSNGVLTHVFTCQANTYDGSFSHIGANSAGNNKFIGQLNEMVIWNKALSAAEIEARYNSGFGSKLSSYTNVVAEYRFDGNYNDSSPNGYHLSAAGSGNSFVTGNLMLNNQNRIQAQNYNMYSGTSTAEVDSTAENHFYGTSVQSGVVFGDAVFHEDGPTMTTTAIVTNSTPRTNGSIKFNANSNNYARAPRIDGTATFTMSLWVKFPTFTGSINGASNTKYIFGIPYYTGYTFGCNFNTTLYSFMLNAEKYNVTPSLTFALGTNVNSNPNKKVTVSASSIPLNTWTHLTGTYNGSIMRFYINGVEAGTIAQTGTPPVGGGDQLLSFGDHYCNSNASYPGEVNFVGEMRDAAIWTNAALTATQVQDLYKKAPDQIGQTPTAYWKMYGGSGTTVVNSINSSQNATLTGATWSNSTPAPSVYPDDASLTRIYTASATTTKNFTLNGGRWIVEADGNGVNVNMTGATYAVSTTTYQSNKNVFHAKNGATFTENSSINGGAHVVPKVVINSPVSGTNLRWNPNISWDDADTCQYKWGVGGTYTNVNCASAGSDIPKPAGMATTTLYVKGIYNDTSYSEKLVTFLYDNVSPAPTDCAIPMDEPTRQYYYLENDVTGDCTATTNVILKGNNNSLLPGYTLTGQLIANATSTGNGFNVTLENITITGTTTANGIGAGNHGGNVTVTDSTLGNLVTNGGNVSLTDSSSSVITTSSDTTGVYAGSITISNSTTSNLTSNSLDSGKDGGDITVTNSNIGNAVTNGGLISVTNSTASVLASNSNTGGILGGNITVSVSTTTAIYANGGDITISTSSVGLLDSTSPTTGIAGGDVTITDSSADSVTTNGGSVTITDSTITYINADGISGIANVGAVTVTNSTLTSISANGTGSGSRGGHVTVTDSNPTSIATNGGNVSLTNVTTSAINANGNTGLSTAATIDITNSTTTDITANGGTGGSGVGGNGAAINITNSSVGLVETNGGSSGKRGGAVTITDSTSSNITTNGGAITVDNSVTSQLASNSNSGGILGGNITVTVSTTTAIYANGGDITVSTSSVGLLDSTSPTDGVAGGDITITNPISTIPSITTNGGDVILENVVVIGAITANGNTGGVSAGTINIEFSTTTAIYANGGVHSSGNGGNGATITIATSTTGLIEASGADSAGDGGDGGIITITNSIGTSAALTPITANGGDSTSCGNGGDSGVITIVDTTYGTITAEPGVGFNGGCPSDTKISGVRNVVTTVGEGHSSIPRPAASTPSDPNAIGGGINPLFRKGLNGLDFTPIQKFNLFGDGNGGGFKPIDAGTTRLPRVFTDLNRLSDFLLDEMPVDILPSLELFVFDEVTEDLASLFPNSSGLLAAVGVDRSQELAGLFRSPKLLSDISNPEKYGLFKVYSGDVIVNTYVAYEQAIENLAQLIKANPSQIIHIGTYVKGKVTDESKTPYIIYQGQKKLMTPTFDGYYATSIIAPNLEGRYLIETSSSVQILLDVLPQNQSNEQSKPWGIFNKLWKLFH